MTRPRLTVVIPVVCTLAVAWVVCSVQVRRADPAQPSSETSIVAVVPPSVATTAPTAGPAWTARVVHPSQSDPTVETIGVTVEGAERFLELPPGPVNLQIVGWTGAGRRTLVVARFPDETDDADLVRVDHDAAGVPQGRPMRLTLPGPEGRRPVSGRGFLTPGGRLVVVQHSDRRDEPFSSTVLRFSADLSAATSEHVAAPSAQGCFDCMLFLGASAEAVVQYSWPATDHARPVSITVSGRSGAGTVELPRCPSAGARPSLTRSPDGRTAAVTCRTEGVYLLDLAAVVRGRGGLTWLRLPVVAASGAISSWWDRSGALQATTAALEPGASAGQTLRSDQMTTWDWLPASTGRTGSWSVASPPLVVNRAYAADGWVARLVTHGTGQIATYDWVSDTDPSVVLDTVADPSQVLAVR